MKKLLLAVLLLPSTLVAAGLQKVEIQIDDNPLVVAQGLDSWSYPIDTTEFDNGQHKVIAMATDLSGNMSSMPVVHFNILNPASLTLLPASQEVKLGDTFVMEIRMNTNPKILVNAVQAVINFPPNLQADSVDINGSAFGILAESKIEPGQVNVSVGKLPPPVGGDVLVMHVTFKAIATGEAQITFKTGGEVRSQIMRSKDSKDILTAVSGATINIVEVADTIAPTVQIQAPTEGQDISNLFVISGTAEDK